MLIKEEKRKGSSKLIKSISSQSTHTNNKENKLSQEFLHKLSSKNIKRIGTKPIVKAFQAVIEVIPEEPYCQAVSEIKEKDGNFSERSGFESIHESGYRKLKRVGKKIGVSSYQETIAEDQSKKKALISEQEGDLEHTIIIKEPQEIQETQLKYTNIAIRESIAGSTKWRKESIQVDDTIDILNSVEPSSSSLFQQVISEEGQLSKKRFSINVNKVELVDKSDVCIENASFIKTESDLIRNSNSFSLPNEIESCVGEEKLSFIQTFSNDDDSKIEELIEEIENNYDKNRGSEESKRSSGNYLQVPNNSSRNSLNRFSSLNKPVGQDRVLGSSLGSSLDSKTEKAKSEDDNELHKSSILSDMSEEEKIIESIEEKSRKRKLEEFTSEPLKTHELANENIRKSEGYKADYSKVERTLSKIEEVIENENVALGTSNVIISKEKLKANFSTSLNMSKKSINADIVDNADRELKKSDKSEAIRIKKMTHSTYSKESREPSAPTTSKTNIKLNEVQVKNNQNSGSLHSPMNPRTPLKNNKIEQTPVNNPKIRELKQNESKSKDQKAIRKNSRKFEVNKLVTEARKVTKEKHIL